MVQFPPIYDPELPPILEKTHTVLMGRAWTYGCCWRPMRQIGEEEVRRDPQTNERVTHVHPTRYLECQRCGSWVSLTSHGAVRHESSKEKPY